MTGNGSDGLLDGLLGGDGLLGSLLSGILGGSGNTSVNIAGTILDTMGGALNIVGQTVNLGLGDKLGETGANNGLNILGNLNLLSGADSILNALNVLGAVGLNSGSNLNLGSDLVGGIVGGLLANNGGGINVVGGLVKGGKGSLLGGLTGLTAGDLNGLGEAGLLDLVGNLTGTTVFLVGTTLDTTLGALSILGNVAIDDDSTSTGANGLNILGDLTANLAGTVTGLVGKALNVVNVTGDLNMGGDGGGTIAISGNSRIGLLDGVDGLANYLLGGNIINLGTGSVLNDLTDALGDGIPLIDGLLDTVEIILFSGNIYNVGNEIKAGEVVSNAGDTGTIRKVINRNLDSLGVARDSRGFLNNATVINIYAANAISQAAFNNLDGNAQENVSILRGLGDAGAVNPSAYAFSGGREALAAAQSVSGQAGARATTIGLNTAREAMNVVDGRTTQLLAEYNMGNEAMNSSGAFPSACCYDPVAATSVNRFWVSGFGMREDADNYKGYADYKYTSGGMMIGYDRFLNQNFAVGGSFGYTYSDNDLSAKRTYANGWEDMENSTNNIYGGAKVGYDWDPSETLALTFAPSIGLYCYHSTGTGFTSSKGLSCSEQKRRTMSMPIDFAVSYDMVFDEENVLTFGGNIGYAYDFSGTGTSTTMTIDGVGAGFVESGVQGRTAGRHQLNLGADVKYAWKQFEFDANYDYFHRAEYDAHRFSGTVGIKF